MWKFFELAFIHFTLTALLCRPVRDSHPESAIFFILFIMVGNFFVVGLFVGVLVDQYNTQHEKFTGSLDMTDAQRHYLQVNSFPLHLRGRQIRQLLPSSN